MIANHHVNTYNLFRVQVEAKRVSRIIKGNELQEAKARAKRLGFAEMGISSTNLCFDSKLAEQHLDKEILEILKDDPDKDTGIMYTRVPVDAQTSTIAESDTGGMKSLDTDADDNDQHSFIEGFDLHELDHIASGSMRVINRLPYFIHDLKRWSSGFNISKFKKAQGLHKRKLYAAAFNPEQVNQQTLNVITRRKRVPRRIPRKSRTHTNVLMA